MGGTTTPSVGGCDVGGVALSSPPPPIRPASTNLLNKAVTFCSPSLGGIVGGGPPAGNLAGGGGGPWIGRGGPF